jgi:hypothetical protein
MQVDHLEQMATTVNHWRLPFRCMQGYNSPTKLESPNASVQVKVVDKTSESCYDAATEGGLCIRE